MSNKPINLSDLKSARLRTLFTSHLRGEALGSTLFNRGYVLHERKTDTKAALDFLEPAANKEKLKLAFLFLKPVIEIAAYLSLYLYLSNQDGSWMFQKYAGLVTLAAIVVMTLMQITGSLSDKTNQKYYLPFGLGFLFGNPFSDLKITYRIASLEDEVKEYNEMCSYLAHHERTMDYVRSNYNEFNGVERAFADNLIRIRMKNSEQELLTNQFLSESKAIEETTESAHHE